jgi:hypothetical protein
VLAAPAAHQQSDVLEVIQNLGPDLQSSS